ncbi:MAG: PmeII family type II restriction endonuclease [Bacteroidetes bacterium]|nr:PmeII family type II restriction endonuclease [Bacteroidota bacterium]
MEILSHADIITYVETNIGTFHEKRLSGLNSLKLESILKRKNPYLFKAKNVTTADHIVRGLIDAFLSSQEETIFGEWLEGLAVFINNKVYSGWKSGISGIDLEFDKDHIRYIVSIKSGPNWGNGSQLKKMASDFQTAIKTLRTSNSQMQVIPINGCCYGRDNKPDKKGIYFKYCGQRFWEFISGNPLLYTEIIEPLGHKAKEKNDTFLDMYPKVINIFILEFIRDFCQSDGSIDWKKIVELNSAIMQPK